jgi:glycosyltransferase involved in cell wall biosynthesis
MRILVASGIFHPDIGGPATYLHQALPELIRRGHSVTVVTFGERTHESYPYPVHRVPRGNWLSRQWEYYRTVDRLWPGHDLVFLHSLGLPLPSRARPRLGRIGGDSAWERAVNKGWVAPHIDVEHFQISCRHPLARLNKALYHREARKLDQIIVPCRFYKRLIASWGVDPGKITVIHNAIRPAPVPQETKSDARRRLSLPDSRLLLTVTRLTPYKGVDYLIQAVTRLKDTHLLVVGDGPSGRELTKLAGRLGVSERVRFLGRIPRNQLPAFYRAADYTVLYAGGEGLSHTLLESLQVGTPVIASDAGGNSEVVRHGENGWLAPFPDVDRLLETIQKAYLPGEQARCSANTGVGLEEFSWDETIRETLRLIESFDTKRK